MGGSGRIRRPMNILSVIRAMGAKLVTPPTLCGFADVELYRVEFQSEEAKDNHGASALESWLVANVDGLERDNIAIWPDGYVEVLVRPVMGL